MADGFKIRRWSAEDAVALVKYLNNKKIWDNCRDGLPYPYTGEDARQFLGFVAEQEIQADYCIEINGEAAGNISFTRCADVERFNSELGYWLAEPYWSMGIMTDALRETIVNYFSNTDVIRVYANVYAGNVASMRVLEKAGFRKCGVSRSACFKNGRFMDCHRYELLKEDIDKRKYILRPLSEQDVPQMQELFHDTVINVNSRDYTEDEVRDWASCGTPARWKELLSKHVYIGAFDAAGSLLGFSSMHQDGYMHSLFVHKDWQGKGVATCLMYEAEQIARRFGVSEITSDVSLTARPFFEKKGYEVVRVQKARANRLKMTNFLMRKIF